MIKQAYELGALQALVAAGLLKEAGLQSAIKAVKGLNRAAETFVGGKPAAVAAAAKKFQLPAKGSPLRRATASAEGANRAAEEFVRAGS